MPPLPIPNTSRWLKWLTFPIIVVLAIQCYCPSPTRDYCSTPTWFKPKNTITNTHPPASANNTFPSSIAFRSTILDYGARVACWPSSGGVWIKHAVPLELDFLNLSRENNTRRPWRPKIRRKWQAFNEGWPRIEDMISEPDLIEEDVFCQKMRMIGADFWDMPADMNNIDLAHIGEHVRPQILSQLTFAWPDLSEDYYVTQGTWLVNLSVARVKYGVGIKGWNNVNSMDERCRVAEEIGALWCPDNEDLCLGMWCEQYPNHCDEAERVSRPAEFWWFGHDE
jgi:hypothetical protein